MVARFYDHQPEAHRWEKTAALTYHIEFPDRDWWYKAETAGRSSDVGRGGTFHRVHISEAAYYRSLAELNQSLHDALADDATYIWETTANGKEGAGATFHEAWERAKDPDSGATLKGIRSVCLWASRYRRPNGAFLLAADPTRGLEVPSEPNPSRPIVADDEYAALRESAPRVHPYMRSLLVLAGETGRRIGAIVALRYADWLPDVGTYGAMRWRADQDKLGREWVAPVTRQVRLEMERLLQERPGLGEAFLFPARTPRGTWPSRWPRGGGAAAKRLPGSIMRTERAGTRSGGGGPQRGRG